MVLSCSCRTERGHSWRWVASRSYRLQVIWVWVVATKMKLLKISMMYGSSKPWLVLSIDVSKQRRRP